jgi:hypothetical protein
MRQPDKNPGNPNKDSFFGLWNEPKYPAPGKPKHQKHHFLFRFVHKMSFLFAFYFRLNKKKHLNVSHTVKSNYWLMARIIVMIILTGLNHRKFVSFSDLAKV